MSMGRPLKVQDLIDLREAMARHVCAIKDMLTDAHNISVNLVMWDRTDEREGALYIGEAEVAEVIRRLQKTEDDQDTLWIPPGHEGNVQ